SKWATTITLSDIPYQCQSLSLLTGFFLFLHQYDSDAHPHDVDNG
ncbi:MAG: hypothetical protein QG613_769, partial [Pseudomonadota bacterium]|nr:hypothetical protein [Pseudomonadota bacterium]